MRISFVSCVGAIVLALTLCGVRCNAQSTNATVGGQITDEQGRVVPGVTVVLTNLNTGVPYEAKTNGDGFYNAPNLPPGIYRANVTKDGFKNIVKGDIELHVQDVASINFELQVGSVSETVTVQAGGLVMNTTDASVSTVVDRQFVENMPLNGRSFQSLIALAPGVVLTKSSAFDLGQFSVNGQRADGNYFTVDGVSANVGAMPGVLLQTAGGSLPATSASGGLNNLVSIDALQEFSIQTSTFAPEFGRTPGGQVSIVTRTGTNSYHGTLFDYFRNDALDANDWFANANNLPKGRERQNDFGGVFGGPIIKNRTFFFFSYEGLRLRSPQTATTEVPTVATRQDPRVAPETRQLLNAFPIPNGPVGPNGLAQHSAGYSDPTTLNAISLRIDHSVGSRVNIFGRWNYAPSDTTQRGSGNRALSGLSRFSVDTQTATIGSNQTLTPAVNNEFRANYSIVTGRTSVFVDDFGGAVPPPDSLMFPSFTSRSDAIFILSISGGAHSQFSAGNDSNNRQRQINLVDNVSVVNGTHQMRFGLDYRRMLPRAGSRSFQQQVNFGNVAGIISGNASFVSLSSFDPFTLLFQNVSGYGQDTWHLARRLTLTYGLRWDINPAPSTSDGNTLIGITRFSDPSQLALAPQGSSLYPTTYGNVAPRVGLAYQLAQDRWGQVVLRGGLAFFMISDTAISVLAKLHSPTCEILR